MSMFVGVQQTTTNDVVDPEFVPTDSELENILKEIFSVDEVSGLPKGDMAYYLSPDGNPQVKAWLENNLLKPRAIKQGSSIEGVTDDMLEEFSKRSDESSFDYQVRLRSIYDDAVATIQKSKENANE